MDFILGIITVVAFVFLVLLVVDKAIFSTKVNLIYEGMTGKEIQALGFKLMITKVESNGSYYAQIRSISTIFRVQLHFVNGRLYSKVKL